tara:strand:+ start:323 stop:766 length:444 start_codon:yes stop_codon:yes gene_type:complete
MKNNKISKEDYPPNVIEQYKMFNELLVANDLPELKIEVFCKLVKSYLDSRKVTESTFTFEHLFLYHQDQKSYETRKKEFWDRLPESRHIEFFVDCNWLQDWSKIDKGLLISKREEYLKLKDYNDYHLTLLNKMIEGVNLSTDKQLNK